MIPGIDELGGLWRRSLLAWPDGRRNTVDWVHWLQGPRFYVDLRQLPGRPNFRNTICLRQLNPKQIDWLASQDGFAGELRHSGGFFEWQREIDFQPTTTCPDQGRLRFENGVLIEEGKDIPYIEHWHREPIELVPSCGLRLGDRTGGCLGFVVRVGDFFMYARGRRRELPLDKPLRECVSSVASFEEAQDLVDCEISQGLVTADGWIIQRSSLPFKEGLALNPQYGPGRDHRFLTTDVSPEGRPLERHWEILDLLGDFQGFPSLEGRRSRP